MTLLTPLFLQKTGADPDISYTATSFRLALMSTLYPTEGVIDPYGSLGLKVTQRAAGANMSVDIAAGTAVITGGDIAFQGAYSCVNTAAVNVVVPVAPGSGTRIHRVIARVKDKLNNGAWSTYEWTLELLPDVGAGTPAEPASAITLGTVSVTVGQASVTNANIVDLRKWARPTLSNTGTLAIITDWASDDVTRPASYRITADGFVYLYGWIRRSAVPFTTTSGVSYLFALLPQITWPSGWRDGIIATNVGPTGCANVLVQATGGIYFKFYAAYTVSVNDWFSLDGVSYKLTA